VVVFVSGKGGVGKTIIALNIGIFLARRHARVILLDADFGLANADILLDVSPLADLADLLHDDRPLEELLVEGPDGLRVLCGVSGPVRPGQPARPDANAWARAIRRLAAACETLLVDCGAGFTPPIASVALLSDLLVLVTTPEPTALTDAYAVLKLLCRHGFAKRVGVIVNMVKSRREGPEVAGRLARVAGRFLGLSIEYLGQVQLDPHVSRAVRERVPLAQRYPRCRASVCLDEISRRTGPDRAASDPAAGWWTRVASLFL